MVNQQLVDYIKSMLDKGYDTNSIRSYLLRSGWPLDQINLAFDSFFGAAKVEHVVHIKGLALIVGLFLLFFHVVRVQGFCIKKFP